MINPALSHRLCWLSLAWRLPRGAVKIADITRIGGERTNILTGLGLVYGLKGTGDGGGFAPAIAPLRSMLVKIWRSGDGSAA